jgi:hypothetical protein
MHKLQLNCAKCNIIVFEFLVDRKIKISNYFKIIFAKVHTRSILASPLMLETWK